MNDEPFAPFGEGPQACPFVAFEDDRDRRSDRPDYRHRCFASPQPEPRAFPHQERYCLSPEFAACPIFLEWARRESAAVIAARRPAPPASSGASAAAAAAGAAGAAASVAGPAAGAGQPSDAALENADEPVLPPFLAGRPRPSTPAPRVEEYDEEGPDPDAGLWGPNAGRGSRYDEAAPASRRPQEVAATARPNAAHPEWERPRSAEQYPRLSKGERRNLGRVGQPNGGGRSNSPVLVALLLIALAMAAFLIVPSLLPRSGSGGPGSTAAASTSVKPSPSTSPTPTPAPTPMTYTIKSGDVLSAIAAKFHTTVEAIMAANPEIKNPDQIAEGQVIIIPTASSASSSPKTGASPSGSAALP